MPSATLVILAGLSLVFPRQRLAGHNTALQVQGPKAGPCLSTRLLGAAAWSRDPPQCPFCCPLRNRPCHAGRSAVHGDRALTGQLLIPGLADQQVRAQPGRWCRLQQWYAGLTPPGPPKCQAPGACRAAPRPSGEPSKPITHLCTGSPVTPALQKRAGSLQNPVSQPPAPRSPHNRPSQDLLRNTPGAPTVRQ